jgi:hypothetical protein
MPDEQNFRKSGKVKAFGEKSRVDVACADLQVQREATRWLATGVCMYTPFEPSDGELKRRSPDGELNTAIRWLKYRDL